MGSSITAAAVTVTVATFDTFCEMKLKFSHKAEDSMWAKLLENTLWVKWELQKGENYVHFALAVQTELLHQKEKQYR